MLERSLLLAFASGLLLGAAPRLAHAEKGRPLVAPQLKLCTGTPGNRYHRVGQQIAAAADGHVRVEVVTTGGSWENLERLADGRCDAAIAQEDTYVVRRFEQRREAEKAGKPTPPPALHRTAALYPEHVHLLCNRAVKASGLIDLPPDTRIYLHRYGSGSFLSWRLFGTLEPRYARLETTEVELTTVVPRLAKDPRPGCLFHVSGLGGRTLRTADTTYRDALRLLPVVDRTLHRPAGPERRQIYTPSTMTARTWPGLLDGDLQTQTVDAVVFTRLAWRAQYPDAAAALEKALIEVAAQIEGGSALP